MRRHLLRSLAFLCLTGAALAQTSAGPADPSWDEARKRSHYRSLIEARGGQIGTDLWVVALRGQGGDPVYADLIVVVNGATGVVQEFVGSAGVEPPGLGWGDCQRWTVQPENRARFEELVGQQRFHSCLVDPVPVANVSPLPPSNWTVAQRFNAYQRMILAQGGTLHKGETAVLGLRGLALDGRRHPVGLNEGGYDDTYVVLRQDARGNPQLWEFPGSTHAGDAQDEDAPAAGVAQLQPGTYRCNPLGPHHGMPCWEVTTVQGSGRVPCWRDADRDGMVSAEEKLQPSTATQILFHQGIYCDIASSIGCLTLEPSDYERFAAVLGGTSKFTFYLLDAEKPLQAPAADYVIGRSVKGKPIHLYSLGNGPRVALLFATIHGDEAAGTSLLVRLKEHLQQHPELLTGWEIRLMPRVNPDSQERTNARCVDLNRNFPHLWAPSGRGPEYSGPAPLSEPEARCVQMAVLGRWPGPAGRPERVLSLHQHGGIEAGMGWLDGDGPSDVKSLLEQMLTSAPDRLSAHKIPDSQGRVRIPGSFGTWVSSREINIPTVTFELSRQDDDEEGNWNRYREALLRFFR